MPFTWCPLSRIKARILTGTSRVHRARPCAGWSSPARAPPLSGGEGHWHRPGGVPRHRWVPEGPRAPPSQAAGRQNVGATILAGTNGAVDHTAALIHEPRQCYTALALSRAHESSDGRAQDESCCSNARGDAVQSPAPEPHRHNLSSGEFRPRAESKSFPSPRIGPKYWFSHTTSRASGGVILASESNPRSVSTSACPPVTTECRNTSFPPCTSAANASVSRT